MLPQVNVTYSECLPPPASQFLQLPQHLPPRQHQSRRPYTKPNHPRHPISLHQRHHSPSRSPRCTHPPSRHRRTPLFTTRHLPSLPLTCTPSLLRKSRPLTIALRLRKRRLKRSRRIRNSSHLPCTLPRRRCRLLRRRCRSLHRKLWRRLLQVPCLASTRHRGYVRSSNRFGFGWADGLAV